MFINASKEYVPHPSVRRLNVFSEENIARVSKSYFEFSELRGFTRIVPLEEISKNGCNLNVGLYVLAEE